MSTIPRKLLGTGLPLGLACIVFGWAAPAAGAADEGWLAVGPADVPVLDLAVAPRGGPTVYAATDFGLYVSRDGGRSWVSTEAATGLSGGVDRVVVDPTSPTTLDAQIFGGGLTRSADAGESWTKVLDGLPCFSDGHTLAISPSSPPHPLPVCGFLPDRLRHRRVLLLLPQR